MILLLFIGWLLGAAACFGACMGLCGRNPSDDAIGGALWISLLWPITLPFGGIAYIFWVIAYKWNNR